MNDLSIKIKGESFYINSLKSVFWKERNALLLSDVHLGKAGHFRKHGIPISKNVHDHDLERLEFLISKYKPNQVIIIGDLFHSKANNEWFDCEKFLENNKQVSFILVKGNHDIMDFKSKYLEEVDVLEIPPFSFTHIKEASKYYNISGHIHPGVRISGRARQAIHLPCFWFSEHFAVMPSFGGFTGMKTIRPNKSDQIIGISNDQLFKLT